MALGLTQNASTANQFCVPCCLRNLNKCCTDELFQSQKEELYIHFYNFKMTPNPYMNLEIEDFSTIIRRADLEIYYLAGTPDYSNFYHISERQPQSYIYPQGGLYHINSKLLPVNVKISSSIYNISNDSRMVPIWDKNSDYIAHVSLSCLNNTYFAGFTLFRVPVSSDFTFDLNLASQAPIGETYYITTNTGTNSHLLTNTINCLPLVSSGTTAAYNNNQNLSSGNVEPQISAYLSYFRHQFLFNNGWQDINLWTVYKPDFTMDWVVTE